MWRGGDRYKQAGKTGDIIHDEMAAPSPPPQCQMNGMMKGRHSGVGWVGGEGGGGDIVQVTIS